MRTTFGRSGAAATATESIHNIGGLYCATSGRVTCGPMMGASSRWFVVLTAGLVVAVSLGCSGMRLPLGAGANAGACRAYVESYNALLCVADHDRLSPIDNCPAELNRSRCDLTEHYACLKENTQCSGGRVDVSGHLSCGDRSCN